MKNLCSLSEKVLATAAPKIQNCLLTIYLQGMAYLHRSIFQSHGHLTSSVCYVDSRWVVKIDGFGLQAFKSVQTVEEVSE